MRMSIGNPLQKGLRRAAIALVDLEAYRLAHLPPESLNRRRAERPKPHGRLEERDLPAPDNALDDPHYLARQRIGRGNCPNALRSLDSFCASSCL